MRIKLEIENDGVTATTEVVLENRSIFQARYRINVQELVGSLARDISCQARFPFIIGSDTYGKTTKVKGFTNDKKDIN